MSSSSYFFTTLNALPIIMVATKNTSKPWEPSPSLLFSLSLAFFAFLSIYLHPDYIPWVIFFLSLQWRLPRLEGAGPEYHPDGEYRHTRHANRREARAGGRGRRQRLPLCGANQALTLGKAQGVHPTQRLDEPLHRAAQAAGATPREDTEDKRR